jgi:hypothetical protein
LSSILLLARCLDSRLLLLEKMKPSSSHPCLIITNIFICWTIIILINYNYPGLAINRHCFDIWPNILCSFWPYLLD